MPATVVPLVIVAARGRARRLAEAAGAVALWAGLGHALGLGANAYLLLGVPITVAFQRGVRRAPVAALWVRDARHVHVDRRVLALAAALAVAPVAALAGALGDARITTSWSRTGWGVAAVLGTLPAAFAFRCLRRDGWRALAACAVVAGGIGALAVVASGVARDSLAAPTPSLALTVLRWLLVYLPVTFVLEEVFFRGALDAHVQHAGERGRAASALFVAVLWGAWHAPLVDWRTDPAARAAGLLAVHVAIGLPLARYWRRSGNLAVPAAAHALIDAVRNALLGGH